MAKFTVLPYSCVEGYYPNGGWESVRYGRVYLNTNNLPAAWNKFGKRPKPALIAQFVAGQSRSEVVDGGKNCQYHCELIFGSSSN